MKLLYNIGLVICGLLLTIGIYMVFRHDNKGTANAWLKQVNNVTAHQNSGQFSVVDKKGTSLIFEWEKLAASDPAFLPKMESLCDILVQAHTPVTVKLLQKKPEVVSTVKLFKRLEPLFKNGIDSLDWNLITEKLKIGSRQLFLGEAATEHGQQDISWFVVAKDKGEPIGFVQFLLSPELQHGTILVKKLMLLPATQHRGIGKLLISSIFKILASVEIKQIILSTLQVNEQAIAAYTSYGFKKYEDKNRIIEPDSIDAYECHFKYITDQSDILQKEAKKLKAFLTSNKNT